MKKGQKGETATSESVKRMLPTTENYENCSSRCTLLFSCLNPLHPRGPSSPTYVVDHIALPSSVCNHVTTWAELVHGVLVATKGWVVSSILADLTCTSFGRARWRCFKWL